ncbi:hypothetical protein K8942_03525 [Candidatus Peribacteria bacterium]|nr:MAG: hypothetical protein K8942_03525 [Candidatus Peribacteria bacterium]
MTESHAEAAEAMDRFNGYFPFSEVKNMPDELSLALENVSQESRTEWEKIYFSMRETFLTQINRLKNPETVLHPFNNASLEQPFDDTDLRQVEWGALVRQIENKYAGLLMMLKEIAHSTSSLQSLSPSHPETSSAPHPSAGEVAA